MKNPTYEHNVVQVVKLGNIYQLQYLASRKMGGFEENINFGLNDDLIPVRPFSLKKNDKKLSNNISRAISTCRQLALSNEWDYFITLTLDPKKYDRFDLEKFHFDVTSFFRSINRRYRVHVNYLLVPERHKNGAWHLHGLISKLPSCLLNINNNGYLDFELYSSKFGWCSLSPVRSQFAVALYITKHLGKQIYNGVTDLHEHLYYCSRGLVRPVTTSIFSADLIDRNFNWQYESDDGFYKSSYFPDMPTLLKCIGMIK